MFLVLVPVMRVRNFTMFEYMRVTSHSLPHPPSMLFSGTRAAAVCASRMAAGKVAAMLTFLHLFHYYRIESYQSFITVTGEQHGCPFTEDPAAPRFFGT